MTKSTHSPQTVTVTPRKGTVVSGDRIIFGVYGIKCDACDYNDMSVPYDDYPSYINKPCPVCGENLLTEKDYKETVASVNAAKLLNDVSDEHLKLLEKQIEAMTPQEQSALIQSLPSNVMDLFSASQNTK